VDIQSRQAMHVIKPRFWVFTLNRLTYDGLLCFGCFLDFWELEGLIDNLYNLGYWKNRPIVWW